MFDDTALVKEIRANHKTRGIIGDVSLTRHQTIPSPALIIVFFSFFSLSTHTADENGTIYSIKKVKAAILLKQGS